MSQNDFGKDMGLVHQAVLTGRRAGAGRTFWTCLAHNADLFKRVVALAEQELIVTEADKDAVKEWIPTLRTSDHPYDEEESYYSRSSHSRHDWISRNLGDGAMKQLFWRAQFSDDAAAICAQVEKCFQLAYAHSALYWCCHYTENPEKWFHHPAAGLSVTFAEMLMGDYRIFLGHHLTLEQCEADESIQAMLQINSEIKRDESDPQLTRFFAERGEELLERSRAALHNALDKLSALLN